jgi:hypothetical protein
VHRHAELTASLTVTSVVRRIRGQMAGQPADDVHEELLRQLRNRCPEWTPSGRATGDLAEQIAALPLRCGCRDS